MAYKIKTIKARTEPKSKPKSFYISSNNYSWENDGKGKMKVSLGNMTDAGWYWDGNQNDLNGFIVRLNNSKIKDEFLMDVHKNNISFKEIKPQLLKSVEKDDGFYELSGDNRVWHFGEIDGDVDESYELEESGITDEKVKEKVYEEYKPVTYEEFRKENLKSYKESMKKAINESNTFEEFMTKQNEIQEDLITERINANQGKFVQAIDEVKK